MPSRPSIAMIRSTKLRPGSRLVMKAASPRQSNTALTGLICSRAVRRQSSSRSSARVQEVGMRKLLEGDDDVGGLDHLRRSDGNACRARRRSRSRARPAPAPAPSGRPRNRHSRAPPSRRAGRAARCRPAAPPRADRGFRRAGSHRPRCETSPAGSAQVAVPSIRV